MVDPATAPVRPAPPENVAVPGSRCVAVWRDEWLAPSETFIYNQVAATRRWRPLPLGLKVLREGLPLRPAVAFGNSIPERLARQIDLRLGLRRFQDILRRDPVSVIHAHFGPDAVTVLPLARRLGIPMVVTFHGFDVTSATSDGSAGGRVYLERLGEVFDYASTLVAVSAFIAGRLRELGAPAEKIVVAPIGVPVGQGNGTPAERCGISFVGRLVQKKGVCDLIDAVRSLPTELTAGEPIRIIGYGPDEAMLRDRAARSKLPIEFLGRRSPAFIADTLSKSRVFCAPSRTAGNGDAEGFGMVYLEAALQAVPVVAYHHGGVPEAVVDGRTGLLAPEGDVEGLAAGIGRLLADPGLAATLGAAGRRRVLDEFDIDHCTRRLEEIYDDASRLTARVTAGG